MRIRIEFVARSSSARAAEGNSFSRQAIRRIPLEHSSAAQFCNEKPAAENTALFVILVCSEKSTAAPTGVQIVIIPAVKSTRSDSGREIGAPIK